VDHESYAYQLALDMGSAPGFWEVLKLGWNYRTSVAPQGGGGKGGKGHKGDNTGGGNNEGWYKLPLVWALGANFNTKFRLGGPWRWEGASQVLVEELWDTIERRGGLFGHVTLSGIPILVFGTISLVLWLLEPVLNVFWPRVKHGQEGKK